MNAYGLLVGTDGGSMSQFEFVFSLFGLLFGLSLVELLGGLARTIEAVLRDRRRRPGAARAFHAGLLTPMLGLFVMLDILTFWAAAWTTRGELTTTTTVLFGGLAFAGSYYLAAHLVFPRDLVPHEPSAGEPAVRTDLDEHYFEVKRIVLGAMLGLAAVQIGWYLTIPALAASVRTPSVALSVAGFAALLVTAICVRSKTANAAILGLLIVRYVYLAIF